MIISGYVTVWDVEDYALTPLTSLPKGMVCPHRSKPPKRLSRWRAHIQSITSLELVDANDVILTSSIDHTVRLWTTRGSFIGMYVITAVVIMQDPCLSNVLRNSTIYETFRFIVGKIDDDVRVETSYESILHAQNYRLRKF